MFSTIFWHCFLMDHTISCEEPLNRPICIQGNIQCLKKKREYVCSSGNNAMFFAEKLYACIWSVLSVSDLWHGIISAKGWNSLIHNTKCTINIPINCTGFLGHKLCITRYFSTLDAAKFTLPAAPLVISGKPEFNYSNDHWLIHLTNKRQFLSQPLKHLQLGLLQLWVEQILKVIHRSLKKHSGFW